MGRVMLAVTGLLLLAPPALAQERPIVAVFDIEQKGTRLDRGAMDRLTDYLESLIATKGFQVVPRSQLKKRLLSEKKKSYKECFDQSCQIEIGQELAAQKSLASRVLKIGSKCKVTLNLFDLKKAAVEAAGMASGGCREDDVVASLDAAVVAVLGVPSAPPAKPEPVPAVEQEAAPLAWVRSLPAGLEFTKSEITVAQFRPCVKAEKCNRPNTVVGCNWGQAGRESHPVNCVDWYQATAFCEWAGGRLPTEQEWFAEASDGGKRKYPWGDEEVSCERAVCFRKAPGCGEGGTWPVCSKPAGDSKSGLCDMCGNVREWTSSSEGSDRVTRGGSFVEGAPNTLSSSFRFKYDPSSWPGDFGFRCVRSVKP